MAVWVRGAAELRDDPDIASILTEGRAHPATVLYLSYRPALEEAGPAKVFDFSRATFADPVADGGARNASSPAPNGSTERHGRMTGAAFPPSARIEVRALTA